MAKYIVLAFLLGCNIFLAVLCEGWSRAYQKLNDDYMEALNPKSHRADLIVTVDGDVLILFDGRHFFEFKGACAIQHAL